jgi:hypothetical protein
MVKRVEKSPSGRYEANVHNGACLMHGMAVEVRAGPSKGAGVSVGEVWSLDAVGRDERGEQNNGNADELEGFEIACQMPILRATTSTSLKSDGTELRGSRESGSVRASSQPPSNTVRLVLWLAKRFVQARSE